QDKRSIVARVVSSLPRRTIIPATLSQSSLIGLIHHYPTLRLESQVVAPCQYSLGCCTVRCRNKQLIHPKVILPHSSQGNPQHLEDRGIKLLSGVEIANDQLQMINQTPAVQLLCFHIALL